MKKTLFITLLAVVLFSCADQKWESKSLLEHGIPVSLAYPETTTLKKSEFPLYDAELAINDTVGTFGIIVMMDNSPIHTDISKVKADYKSEYINIEGGTMSVVEEFEDGFIFKNEIDSANTAYMFKKYVSLGDRLIMIENAADQMYDEEQIKNMYTKISE